ncbi:NAD-dependent methanol dehydrogenase [Thiorhodovibrio winogradskyi]|uniref:NAD-dependent methanol dehydrogenase n=1 Tax=Thiorhodovibrio winogradskyi TaxID=77007 RepID=A0ABZ0S871_9GAMM|nr:iron-containing alcohol dehydrogenase [Thiorhodovibrio winogradskyi]
MTPFSIARLPSIEFGAGARAKLPALVRRFGQRALLVSGGASLIDGPFWPDLAQGFADAGVLLSQCRIIGEPSPRLIDDSVRAWRDAGIEVVIAIGGGSALDAGKAIAGLLPGGGSVLDYLEGVGPELPYRGPALPLIAVPTTAGTGSEATKNAVLSVRGPNGYKKSFRDEQLVAAAAVVDPDFLATCPPAVIAGNGMDALTQLLEAYVSARANPLCDALALDGLRRVRDGLPPLARDPGDAAARANMAYAALLSGVVLAQTGLGSVHGLASPLGALFPIPHGVVCGTLVAAATRVNLQALREREPAHPVLAKYARLGRLLSAEPHEEALVGHDPGADAAAADSLVALLEDWTKDLALPRLGALGVTPADHAQIVACSRGSSMKTNPIVLTDAEIGAILSARQ